MPTLPPELPDEGYSRAPFGDFLTVDVAVRLPYLFRHKYGDEQILRDPVLSTLYLRLLQFDDVRPQSALLDYMLDASSEQFDAEDAWERLVPILEMLLSEIHDNPFFRRWLSERAHPWTPVELEAARASLKIGAWRNRVSRELARKVTHYFMGGDPERPELVAQREQLIQTGAVRLVLAGHTHMPGVCLIGSDPHADRFYINTGTWRTAIPSTADRRTFGRLKALTYVKLFASDEDPAGQNPRGSFDYWTGFSRHWTEDSKDQDDTGPQ
jgi:hypothetical protein